MASKLFTFLNLTFKANMFENGSYDLNAEGLIVFSINGLEFCLNIKDITFIINPHNFNLHQSKDKKGKIFSCITISNKVIPLIDATEFLGLNSLLKNVTEESHKRILVIDVGNKLFGLVVQKIVEILTLNTYKVTAKFTPETKPGILGNISLGNKNYYMPDLNYLLIDEQY